MKKNKLTHGSNMRWESSRMFLPEHVEALIHNDQQSSKKTKPLLDPQQLDAITTAIQLSFQDQVAITCLLFAEDSDHYVTGVVTQLDSNHNRVQLKDNGHLEWVDCTQIIHVL